MTRRTQAKKTMPRKQFFRAIKKGCTGDRFYQSWQEAIADVREHVAVYHTLKTFALDLRSQ